MDDEAPVSVTDLFSFFGPNGFNIEFYKFIAFYTCSEKYCIQKRTLLCKVLSFVNMIYCIK